MHLQCVSSTFDAVQHARVIFAVDLEVFLQDQLEEKSVESEENKGLKWRCQDPNPGTTFQPQIRR